MDRSCKECARHGKDCTSNGKGNHAKCFRPVEPVAEAAKLIKAYKGFDKNLKCRGFQYEIGKEYVTDKAELCHSGFHACENPLDCYGFYAPGQSRFCEVEIADNGQRESCDTKVVGKRIKIGAELSVLGVCKAHFEYVTARCTPSNSKIAGPLESAAAGNLGALPPQDIKALPPQDIKALPPQAMGRCRRRQLGRCRRRRTRRCRRRRTRPSAAAGNWGSAAAGNWGSAAAGNWGSAAAGYKGSAAAGNWGSACCRGGKVRGGIGCAICCTEVDSFGKNIAVAAAIVDGVKVKADTWYTTKNGVLVEVAQ